VTRDLDGWRPLDTRGPACGYAVCGAKNCGRYYDGGRLGFTCPGCGSDHVHETCGLVGAHYCHLRADRVLEFCREVLVHTSGPLAGRAFAPEDWQEWEILRPLFGEVWWAEEWDRYVRRHTVAYVVISRKNGKSSLAAAIVLYLLVADDEEAAEIYGAAKDTKQAGKVYQPVQRMRNRSARLQRVLRENIAARRIYRPRDGSYYEIITADALGELGHNPHGFVLDEVLSQPDRTLWDALRSAAGARTQPLFLAVTTETNDGASFGAALIDEAEAIQEDPARAPHVLAWVHKTPTDEPELARLRERFADHPDLPVSLDVFDERNWRWSNPALGTFKSTAELRRQADEARQSPAAENSFRQFQLNQRVQQVTRWMPMLHWDRSAGLVDEADLEDLPCYGGLDLASTTDLAALAWLFPPPTTEPDGTWRVAWRFWTPEAQVPALDEMTAGQASVWVRQGFLTATEGDWIDYWGDPESGLSVNSLRGPDRLAIHPQVAADARRFRVLLLGYDKAEATASSQHFRDALHLAVKPVPQGFALTEGMKDVLRLVKAGRLAHGGHPVARWCFDAAEVKRRADEEVLKLVKPDRRDAKKRVDAVAALATAFMASKLHQPEEDEYTDPAATVF